MNVEEGLKYTESHEWIRVEGDTALIGITDYAQESLGDIVYVEVPEAGTKVAKGDEAVNIESVKVAEAVYAPVTGTVKEVNEDLEDAPEMINKDAYGTFIYSITISDPSELDSYMDAAAYKAFVDAQE
ncbi:MAG: glycine cleavage system protein GcvH [Spirochaetaceae bacterium]|nr:glycine cleavage system protein GcvH [Spirochaetaceae bacterium]MDT8297662.1 glycine cleavage system protein GcvH [Spirochaetaceae bacterium]